MDLTTKKCVPCEGGVPSLSTPEVTSLLSRLRDWKLRGTQIEKDYQFKNFVEALGFVNRVGEIAEKEGHHPDLLIYQFNKVRVNVWTHAVSGLTENDFILAAKIDQL